MYRILGNSTEKVPIPDLKDVIYYKQSKEYNDSEYESSKDLKREIQKGRLLLLSQNRSSRGSSDVLLKDSGQGPSVSIGDIKAAVRELLPEFNKTDVYGAVRDLAPLIIEVVRQEISKLSIQTQHTVVSSEKKSVSSSIDPMYIPDVNVVGMVANIKTTKENKISSNNTEEALRALRALRDLNNI